VSPIGGQVKNVGIILPRTGASAAVEGVAELRLQQARQRSPTPSKATGETPPKSAGDDRSGCLCVHQRYEATTSVAPLGKSLRTSPSVRVWASRTTSPMLIRRLRSLVITWRRRIGEIPYTPPLGGAGRRPGGGSPASPALSECGFGSPRPGAMIWLRRPLGPSSGSNNPGSQVRRSGLRRRPATAQRLLRRYPQLDERRARRRAQDAREGIRGAEARRRIVSSFSNYVMQERSGEPVLADAPRTGRG
jgi:hypothetical protein